MAFLKVTQYSGPILYTQYYIYDKNACKNSTCRCQALDCFLLSKGNLGLVKTQHQNADNDLASFMAFGVL